MNNTCVAFGNFDGVHIGHRAIIDKLKEVSTGGLSSVVLAFDYDESLLKGEKILSTREEKQYLLSKLSIDQLIFYKVEEKNKNFIEEDFIKEVLVDKLGAKVIVVGKEHCNIDLLRKCSIKYGYILEECETVTLNGEEVTSKRIKAELEKGQLHVANELLGQPYLLLGKVMHGKALGRTVGMPTANLGFNEFKLLPAFGVYGTLSEIEGKKIKGLTNIGKRPSVDNYNYVTIETFLLDFSGDLYDKTISLEIHAYIRGVKKFNNLEEVKSQVNKDLESIRAYLNQI